MTFNGEETTLADLHRKCPAYSREWLRKAIKDGCKTLEDLATRWQQRHCSNLRRLQSPKPWKRQRAY